VIRSLQNWVLLFLIFICVAKTDGNVPPKPTKNILLINSYHQGYAWTDSLTLGIIKAVKLHPEYNLFIENLNSKQFGKSRFEIDKEHFQKKYSGVTFDGALITDNDALDFALQFDKELFPDAPVVFIGIPNPEEYLLEGTSYYGLKETGSSQFVMALIHNLLPESKHLLVITDKTTTGMINRKEFIQESSKFDQFSVLFPEVVDLDSIYKTVSSGKHFDAIFYVGLSQDRDGRLIDPVPVAKKICELSRVPVFTNDLLYNNPGIVGGLFRNGENHGIESVNLLLKILNSRSRDSIKHIYPTEQKCFFDYKALDKLHISIKSLPDNSLIFNKETIFSRQQFRFLLTTLVVLVLIILVLTVVNRRRKNEHKKSVAQLDQIRIQKDELEDAYTKLNSVMLEFENTNIRLNESNINLSEAKKKAEESDNLKSAFLANVSHEIRTPLNSIVGFSSLLSDDDLTPELRNSYIELIESNTESLLVLIDEIIDLSKIEAQQLTLRKQEFSIDLLLTELSKVFTQGHPKSEVELRIRKVSDSKELFIYSDRVRINQIFVNLLSNAYKFTESGMIEFGYEEDKYNEIQLFVKDSGIGISKEHHQLIFERFRKLNSEDRKVYRGTGLGLAVAYQIVKEHGGEIQVKSGEPWSVVFTVSFPIRENQDRRRVAADRRGSRDRRRAR